MVVEPAAARRNAGLQRLALGRALDARHRGRRELLQQVIGYELEVVPVGDESYSVLRSSGKRNAGLVQLERARDSPALGAVRRRHGFARILVRVWQEGGKVLREPAEVDFAAAGANRVALIADPSGAALFLYQLDEKATADPGAIADARRLSPPPAPPAGDGSPNVH